MEVDIQSILAVIYGLIYGSISILFGIWLIKLLIMGIWK